MQLLQNEVPNKLIYLNTSNNTEAHDNFSATVTPGSGKVIIDADLTGLKK